MNVSVPNSLIAVGFNFFALHSNYTQPACNVNKRLYNKGETTLKVPGYLRDHCSLKA